MKANNGYISLPHALSLINRGWVFRQDLKQTEFKVCKGTESLEVFKLNERTATALKRELHQIRQQTKIDTSWT